MPPAAIQGPPDQSNRFFLGYRAFGVDTAYINEADADIDRTVAALCTSASADSTYWWVMIAGNGCCGYAQAGYSHLASGQDAAYNYFYYWEDKDNNTGQDTWGAPALGGSITLRSSASMTRQVARASPVNIAIPSW